MILIANIIHILAKLWNHQQLVVGGFNMWFATSRRLENRTLENAWRPRHVLLKQPEIVVTLQADIISIRNKLMLSYLTPLLYFLVNCSFQSEEYSIYRMSAHLMKFCRSDVGGNILYLFWVGRFILMGWGSLKLASFILTGWNIASDVFCKFWTEHDNL